MALDIHVCTNKCIWMEFDQHMVGVINLSSEN